MKFKYLYLIIFILSLVTIASAAVPVANFTSNVTTGLIYPLVIQFNDTSTDLPTTWNWSFGDGRWFNTTNSALKNTTYQYAVAQKYTVSLLVNNTDGSNITTITDYINLTSDNDDNLTTWMHMNGTNGSATFTSQKGIAWLANGGAVISTLVPNYGGASGWFPSTSNSYLSTPNSSAFSFGTRDFTIEFWINVTSVSGTNVHMISKSNNSRTQGWGLDRTYSALGDSGWDFWMGNDSVGETLFNAPIPNKTWTHIAVERISGTIYLYINGNLTTSQSGFNANYDTNNPVWIAREQNNYFNGYMDEFRISKVARWTSNFTPPFNQYDGVLETIYPDINPTSTFRYKTNPEGIAYVDNLTQRNRTIQIQNITNTSYVLGLAYFQTLFGHAKSVQLNLSYYPTGMTLISSSIDNVNGIVEFNISNPTGFSPGTNRASIIDYTFVYTNYTDGSVPVTEYFGYGYLINKSTQKIYPIHNFLGTPVTYGDWNFTANFTADNLTPLNGTPVNFVGTFNGSYPNRWNWSFGDGTFNNGTNSTISHTYTSGGLKTVSLTEYLWQNITGVTNTTIKTNYVDVYEEIPIVSFTTNFTPGRDPLTIQFNDTSTGCVTAWNWTFNNVTGNDTEIGFSNIQNFTHVFTIGNYSIRLNASNAYQYNITTQPYFINVSPMLNPIIVKFITFPTSGIDPLTIRFNDTSTGCVTAWNWTFNNVTGNNTDIGFSTIQNFTRIFTVGNYSIRLNASNSDKYNISITPYFINISATITPMTDFTSIQSGNYPPVTVSFTDTSINTPTTYYWIFGDGNTSTLRNPTNIYMWCGDFTVEFRSENSAGFNWKNKTDDVSVSCIPQTTADKLAAKVTDTQNVIVIGVILIIAAGITVYTVTLFTKKS